MTELSTVQKIMYKELGHHGKSGKASQDEDTVDSCWDFCQQMIQVIYKLDLLITYSR